MPLQVGRASSKPMTADMPIGLPDAGHRQADVPARELAGPQ